MDEFFFLVFRVIIRNETLKEMMENRTNRTNRPRLQRSERIFSESHLTSWEIFVRDSLLTLAWPDLLNVVSGLVLRAFEIE